MLRSRGVIRTRYIPWIEYESRMRERRLVNPTNFVEHVHGQAMRRSIRSRKRAVSLTTPRIWMSQGIVISEMQRITAPIESEGYVTGFRKMVITRNGGRDAEGLNWILNRGRVITVHELCPGYKDGNREERATTHRVQSRETREAVSKLHYACGAKYTR